MPRYGYLLKANQRVIGAILLISSKIETNNLRCNVSSWFVQPEFRSYASLLVSKALSHRDATYLNITPAPHTLPIVRAQGYRRYSSGVFVALPAVQFRKRTARVVAAGNISIDAAESYEHQLIEEHVKYGCISVWCETANSVSPFLFRPRVHKAVPCAQLVYCRSIDDFTACAGPLGRHLAACGRPFVVIDANGPIPGLLGKYFNGRMPKYYRGPNVPRLGDLAYTEMALFGV
jgi:hypothetical protein